MQHADDAGLDDAEPRGAERHRGEQRADERDEDRARQAERHVSEGQRLDDEVQAQGLGHPDEPGHQPSLAGGGRERAEHAFLEPVVQLEHLVGQRQPRR